MKKLLLLFLTIATLTSCELTEEITFKEDGSGEYNITVDMSAMMSMTKGKEKDSVMTTSEKKKKIDSIISMKELIRTHKDSIANLSAEERAALEEFKDAKLHMIVDEEAEKMQMSYIFPFKSIDKLEDIGKKIKKLDKIGEASMGESIKKDSSDEMFGGFENEQVKYSYNGRKFTRRVTVKKKKNETPKKEEAKEDKQMEELMQLFTYKIIYHFPKRIKSVSNKEATLSPDGKTLYIRTTIDKINKNPKLLDFKVTF